VNTTAKMRFDATEEKRAAFPDRATSSCDYTTADDAVIVEFDLKGITHQGSLSGIPRQREVVHNAGTEDLFCSSEPLNPSKLVCERVYSI